VDAGFAIRIPAKAWIPPRIRPVFAPKTLTLDDQKLGCAANAGRFGFYYVAKKNSRTMTDKLVKKKYDPVARKHVEFKESKIK
jgi:ribosomal protein L33